MPFIKILFSTLLVSFCVFQTQAEVYENKEITRLFKKIPVHDRGRLKPLDTFSRESVEFIRGKPHPKSLHWVLTWILLPEQWDNSAFMYIQNSVLKEALELDASRRTFSPLELLQNENLKREVAELKSRKLKKMELDSYFSDIEELESRLVLYQAIRGGFLPLWLPEEIKTPTPQRWVSATELSSSQKKTLTLLLEEYIRALSVPNFQLDSFKKVYTDFRALSQNSVDEKRLVAEVHYNFLNPFRWSWIFYFLSLVGWFSLILFKKYQRASFLTLSIIAFILNTYGLLLRSFIMMRPPVSNMFETLIWVPWVAFFLALIFSIRKKEWFPVLTGAFASFFCLMLVDQARGILNGNLEPLEAVLRSNFWLSTHVLVITISYAAFLVAFFVGDFLVFQSLRGRSLRNFKAQNLFLKKCLQIGVFFLALGTLLGAVWADYSWGRFWGWDPKEVWALVSLLCYLALLHARLQGWVKDFGMAMGSIFCFFMIIMAWYGVNFILGKGLHSYGFGQGGLPYVLAFIGFHLMFMFLAWRKGRIA